MRTTGIQLPLERSERLLWSGVPKRGLVLRPADALMIPFSIMWGGFAVFWESRVIQTGAPFFFRLWGIPFVLVGAYITVGRFMYDAWRRAGVTYGLTNDRVIIATSGPFPALQSLNLRTLTDITLTERPDGTGTIAFGRTDSSRRTTWMQYGGAPAVPSFEMIAGAKQVYNALRDAQRALTA